MKDPEIRQWLENCETLLQQYKEQLEMAIKRIAEYETKIKVLKAVLALEV